MQNIRSGICLLVLGVFIFGSKESIAKRDEEIKSCLPGELKTWKDGLDRPIQQRLVTFTYQPSGQSLLSSTDVRQMISEAARVWSECGIKVRLGTDVSTDTTPENLQVTVKWGSPSMEGVAHANISSSVLLLSPKIFQILKDKGGESLLKDTLQMTLSHEMGHFLGMMSHSMRCVDVMSYYTSPSGEKCFLRDSNQFYSVPEYRSKLPTACDIERCKRLNGNLPPIQRQ